MKKFLSVLIALLTITVLFTSCGKKNQNVKLTEQLIKDIDKNITIDSGEKIKNAKNYFDNLTDTDKAHVSNKKKLEKAVSEYEVLENFNNKLEEITKIANHDSQNYKGPRSNMSELIAQYDDLQATYKKMNKQNKEYFKDKIEALNTDIEKLKEYEKNSIDPAAAYVKAFNDTYKGKNYTIVKIGCIKQPRNDNKEYHFFALTYKNEKGEEKNVYATARYIDSSAYATIMSRPELFFADKPVSKEFDALENGNINLDLNTIIQEANKLQVAPPVTTTEEPTTKKNNKKDSEPTTKKNSDKKETTTADETTVKDSAETTAA